MRIFFQDPKKLMFLAFGASAIYSLFYSFFGIDMTDACLHFYIQRNSFHGAGDVWMSVPLTNFIGGWWLSISPISNHILWANFGGAVLYIILMTFVTKIYLEFFDQINWKDWLVVICVILLIPAKDTISYYHFPITLCFIFFYYLLRCMKNDDGITFFFVLGIIGGIIVFSRFTFITILFLPIIFDIYNRLFFHKNIKKQILIYLLGIIVSTIPLFLLFLLWKSQFVSGGSELTIANILYRIKSLLYVFSTIKGLIYVTCTLLLLIGLVERYISEKKQKILGSMLLSFSIIVSLFALILYSTRVKEWWLYLGPLPNEKIWLLLIPIWLFAILFIALFDQKLTGIKLNWEIERPFIIFVCMFSLIVPLGSDVAYGKLGYMAPVYLMLLGGCLLHRTILKNQIRLYVYFAFLCGGVIVRPLYTYLDAPILQCNTSPRFPGLKNLFTTKQRAQDWDQLLNVLQTEVKNEKEVLMVGYLNFGPLYLLNLRDWNHGVCAGGKDFMKRYYFYSTNKKLPLIAFVDEKSDEFESFKGILQNNYHSVFCLKRQYFRYSVWRRK